MLPRLPSPRVFWVTTRPGSLGDVTPRPGSCWQARIQGWLRSALADAGAGARLAQSIQRTWPKSRPGRVVEGRFERSAAVRMESRPLPGRLVVRLPRPRERHFRFPFTHKGRAQLRFLSDAPWTRDPPRRATTDETVKARLSREIDARVFDLAPWIFLWFPVDIWASQPDVTGWRIPLVFTGQRWMEAERTR